MLMTYCKCLVFLLISFFLFGCGIDPEPDPEPDPVIIYPPPWNGNNKESSITVKELDLDDAEALLEGIRVLTDRDNKEPDNKEPDNKEPDNKEPDNKEPDNKEPDVDNNDAAPEIDIGDIQNEIENVRVPVDAEPKKQDKKDVISPKIVHSNIKDGAKNVGRASLTRITFSEPIAKGTLVLRTEGGRVVETDIQYGNEIVNIKRLGEDFIMKPLTTYIIEGSVSDAAGNKTKINIMFTTADIEAIKGF